MPLQHRTHPHKRRPLPIRRAETAQLPTVRIRSPRSHQYRLDVCARSPVLQVFSERFPHVFALHPEEIETVVGGRRGDKGVDLRKGILGDDVDRLEGCGERRRMRGEAGEVEEEEDEAVFSAVVGEGEGMQPVREAV